MSKAETPFRLGLVTIAAAVGVACSRPEAPRIIQVVVPPFEKAGQNHPQDEKTVTTIPEDIKLLMANPSMRAWRESLPPEITVSFLDYG